AYTYRRESNISTIAAASVIMLNSGYLAQLTLGFWDILWVMLSALSIISYRRPLVSGLIFGVALALKQTPVLLAPFILIWIYQNERIRAASLWVLGTVATFLAFNGYYILTGASSYISGVLLPISGKIFGIGFGPSQISFLGYYFLPPEFFTAVMIVMAVLSILLFTFLTKSSGLMPVALFPLIIFFFNYRLILEYVIYWPIIALLVLPKISEHGSVKSKSEAAQPVVRVNAKKAIIATLAAAFVISAIAVPVFQHPYEMKVSGPAVALGPNSTLINNMSMNVYFLSNLSYHGVIYLRIITGPPLKNENGAIWESNNLSLSGSGKHQITFHATLGPYSIPPGTYRGVLYNNTILGAGTFQVY
ncbi:MAG: glycosyltransferase 87 family protein, partial [Thermoplasmataceae archaeon]